MQDKRRTVVVAMSGGVDSSAAAALLLDEGFRVMGVTFRMWEEDVLVHAPASAGHCSLHAVEAAALAAEKLGIEHSIIDLRERFRAEIVEPFAREYLRGRTPNPCVECNRRVKFPTLVEVADEVGADLVATGHYARVRCEESGDSILMRAAVRAKDQSYALYGIDQERLSRSLFPNGGSSKDEIRRMTLSRGLTAGERDESQEICFLCGGDYRDFISRRYPQSVAPGLLLDSSGRELGEHRGIAFYTVGQRKGLGVSTSRPLYVMGIDPSRRAVILGSREDVPGVWLRAEAAHWIRGAPPAASFEAEAMVRYNMAPVSCGVEISHDGFEVSFGDKVWALTPGQHAVLYKGDEVLGGGVITSVR